MKKALITGITGQDGYFLSQLLIEKNYEVHGIIRRNSQSSLGSLDFLNKNLLEKIILHWGDITDENFITNLIRKEQYEEIYHLAAQSFVGLSFKNPKFTYDVNLGGTLILVNALKDFSKKSKLYFAGTSEMFGKVQEIPQKETTAFYPRSPYGVSKLAAYWTVKNYRESYNLFLCSGILFNHESEVRGIEFVTRKITNSVAKIKNGKLEFLELGNLDVKRDWGYAKDYVYGMWLMLQQENPEDFVLSTGNSYSVREFVDKSFKNIGLNLNWEGSGINEIGRDENTEKIIVKVNPDFFRPAEVDYLIGDSTKAKKILGWQPKVGFDELVNLMVNNDLKNEKKEEKNSVFRN